MEGKILQITNEIELLRNLIYSPNINYSMFSPVGSKINHFFIADKMDSTQSKKNQKYCQLQYRHSTL